MPIHKGGKKCRKHGRKKAKCKQYNDQNRKEINKAQKQKKHLKNHPNDKGGSK